MGRPAFTEAASAILARLSIGQFTEIAAMEDGATEALLAAETVTLLLTVPQVVWPVTEVTCTIALAPAATVPSGHDNTPSVTEHPGGTVQFSPKLTGSVSLMVTPVAAAVPGAAEFITLTV